MFKKFGMFHSYNLSPISVHGIFGSSSITSQADLLNLLVKSLKDHSYHSEDYNELMSELNEDTKNVFLLLSGQEDINDK